jgi:phospholipid/cholesterol/gamma-HCH transport system substrate-binding protein
MESKLNYTLVGFVVALLLASIVVFTYWLGKHNGSQQYDYYHVYMTESVSGLSNHAAVKFMGVDVGSVITIDINPDNSEQVALLLKIRQGIPVKVDSKASLRFYGVTGLAFIELTGGGKNSARLRVVNSDQLPVIQASASTFSNIEKTLNELARNSAVVLENMEQLLSDENLKQVSSILLKTDTLLDSFQQQQPHISRFIETGIVAETSIDNAFNKLAVAAASMISLSSSLSENGHVAERKFSQTLAEIDLATNSVEQMSDSFKRNYADAGTSLTHNVEQSLTSFRQLLYQMEVLVIELQQTAKKIKTSPADLLLKRSQIKLGPGEEAQSEN